MKHLFAAAALALALSPISASASDFSDAFQAELDVGHIPAATELAQARLETAPQDPEARFALGVSKFLLATQNLAQGLHRFGLRNQYSSAVLGLAGLPFLRLPVPPNPDPDQVTYQGLRALLSDFVDDLADAEETLAALPDGPVTLRLDLGTVRLDLNGDGEGDPEENLAIIFDGLNGRLVVDATDLKFAFDESDVPWLRGYCNLLMALAEIPLAHDWERAFEATFHGVFPESDMPGALLAEEARKLHDVLQAYYDRPEGPPGWGKKPDDLSWDEWRETETYRDSQEFARLEFAYFGASIADLIAFVHLFDWPVVEPARAASARLHLLSMIAHSRESWRRIHAETDDDAEWVPSPKQTGRFTNLTVSEEVVQGWHGFLDEFEAVLTGDKLIRHWRFAGNRGVNVRRMFEEPGRLDPIMIATGPGVLPYLEDGEVIDSDTVGTVVQLIGAGFFAYFVWFN